MSPRYRGPRHKPALLPRLLLLAVVLLLILALCRFLLAPKESPDSSAPSLTQPDEPSVSASVVIPSQAQPTDQEVPKTPQPSPPELPSIDDAPWYLTLVSKEHPLDLIWDITTMPLSNGLLIDSRIYDSLTAMLNDCKAEGLDPIVCSAYRTVERQTELFEAKIDVFMRDGLSYDEAYLAASRIVAIPGTSEHNLGLCVDICAASYQLLDDAQAETAEQLWLMEHCAEYGFILRYPKGKEEITGIIWEPWHYRYVGIDAARAIEEYGLCLEEYLALQYDFS